MASRRPFDCEFPRTPDREASLADTTAFFDDLQLDDDGCHVLRSVTGEEIRLGADDNVPVELQRVPRASTPVDLNTTVQSEFDVEETEVEVSEIPRGYDPDTLCGNEGVGHLVKPSFQDEKTEISVNGKKAEQFVKDLTENPEWARSIQYVKLNAAMPKEILLNLINHLYGNVNDRPKYLTLLSKLIDEDDLPHFIKIGVGIKVGGDDALMKEYLHFDHEAVNDRGVVFSEKRNIITFDVENEMTPLFLMQNPTYDLIDLIVRLSCERPTCITFRLDKLFRAIVSTADHMVSI
ncbi:hypothetical protein DICVIV_10893 [Dictyocaulus viviparus]|uniref:Uncharacterized protein n=1 Tax=Dictyocaulus viviparus TaxID=29172 RepID=A0A0D8XH80_DICVI|nr:hypothetical protein DICVIV_10893 [Dictyocaulus viviparus]